MVNVCCVDGCIQSKDVIYFNVPNSKTLRKRWLEAFKPNCKVTSHSVVCSKHFLEEQYETIRGKKRLKAKVIPSIFDDISKTKQSEKSPKKGSSDGSKRKKTEKEIGNEMTVKKEEDKGCNGQLESRIETVEEVVEKGDISDSIVKRTVPKMAPDETNKDIEEIITNYHIKQTRPLKRDVAESNVEGDTNCHTKQRRHSDDNRGTAESGENDPNVIDVDNLKDPVFIEVSVDKGGDQTGSQDCLMLLESVQCECDPSSLMLAEPEPDPDPRPDPGRDSGTGPDPDDDDDDDVIDLGEKKEEPISLLTSSDEDEVIIEEPKIDTVVVSDETDEDDEDDVPLVNLVKNIKPRKSQRKKSKHQKEKKKTKMSSNKIEKLIWSMYEYYCVECQFRTSSKSEYKVHSDQHPTMIQVCQLCGYTTASKTQFTRHRRRHIHEERSSVYMCSLKEITLS